MDHITKLQSKNLLTCTELPGSNDVLVILRMKERETITDEPTSKCSVPQPPPPNYNTVKIENMGGLFFS